MSTNDTLPFHTSTHYSTEQLISLPQSLLMQLDQPSGGAELDFLLGLDHPDGNISSASDGLYNFFSGQG
jgi:hypothetical protein